MLWKQVMAFRIRINWTAMKPMLKYSAPIFITGLAGMGIEQLDKIMIPRLLADNFYANMTSLGALGVYGQTLKLSIFISLAIQAFRYAAEPFFFSNAAEKNSPDLFARVLHYFVLACLAMFVAVSVNVDLLAEIFLRNPAYRIALYIVPIALFSKLLWGVYVNMSIWFKLTDQTIFGTYFNLIGAGVIIVGNLLLIPVLGFMGSLISMALCYIVMCVLCYYYGNKYFPIPYKFVPLLWHSIAAIGLVFFTFRFSLDNRLLDIGLNLAITVIYLVVVWQLEKKKLMAKGN